MIHIKLLFRRDRKESARAVMRRMVKRLLGKYKYPLGRAEGAANIVTRQAELMSTGIM